MITFDDRELKELEKDLKTFAKKAQPFAQRDMLNKTVFEGRKLAHKSIENRMFLKGVGKRWTLGSVQVDKAKGLNSRSMVATLGSLQDYMAKQEFGGFKHSKGKEGIPIATRKASGEGRGSGPRKRLPKKGNRAKFRNSFSRGLRKPKTKKQELLFKVQDAVSTGRRQFYHDFGGSKKKGIFRVTGGRKNFKRGWPVGARIQMMYSLEEQSVRIPKNPWLLPTTKLITKHMPEFYKAAIIKQLQRRGLFKR